MNTWKISGMLIVYWPITINFRTREQTSKPPTNSRCCLRFSYLAPYWLISRNTVTFHKYFWCSRSCEFYSNFLHWADKEVCTKWVVSLHLSTVYSPVQLYGNRFTVWRILTVLYQKRIKGLSWQYCTIQAIYNCNFYQTLSYKKLSD